MGSLIERMGGIHFRVLLLVTGLAATLMAAQLVTDTAIEVRESHKERLAEAQSLTNVVARSLEKQFDYFELSEIEGILASVLARKNAPVPFRSAPVKTAA